MVGICGWGWWDGICIPILFVSGLATFLLITTSLVMPYGGKVEVRPATVEVAFDAFIVIRAVDWPIRTSRDIRFSTKPVQIKKTEQHNTWGFDLTTTYEVEIVPSSGKVID